MPKLLGKYPINNFCFFDFHSNFIKNIYESHFLNLKIVLYITQIICVIQKMLLNESKKRKSL